jgi:Ricin-type beta-trefoil lectin domain/Domain of unknown function (DUF5122) beta-propeller
MRIRMAAVMLVSGATFVANTSGAAAVATASSSASASGARAGTTSPASATLPGVVSQTPVPGTPNVYYGSSCGKNCGISTVYSTAVVGSEVVVAGSFGRVCSPLPAQYAPCPATVQADAIFAYNLGTGAIDPNFKPTLDHGPIYALAAGPANTVYAGGQFTKVNGASHAGVVQLNVTPGHSTDGQVVPSFTGQLNQTVYALAFNRNALYVGGAFTSVNQQREKAVARLDATTGATDTSFHFTVSNQTASRAAPQVRSMSLTTDGGLLAIGGSFQTVNHQARPRVALIDTGGGRGAAAKLADWSAPILAANCQFASYVSAIALSPDGSFLVVATSGSLAPKGPSVCDAAARFSTAPTGSSVQPTWINFSGRDSFFSVAVAGSVVYVGGHDRWANNECGNNAVCESNAVVVDGLAALDASTGLALPWWHPQTARGVGVRSLTTFPAGLYPGSHGGLILGTDVHTIGGSYHSDLAMFPLASAATPTPGGPILSGIFSQGRLNGADEQNSGVAAMCVDDATDSSAAGNPVQLSTCENTGEQNWTVEPDRTIQINGLCLDTAGGGTAAGTLIVVNPCNGADTQRWTQGPGNALVNQASGLCLADPNESVTNGTQLQILSCDGGIEQRWPLPAAPAPPPPPATGSLSSVLQESNGGVPCMSDVSNAAELLTCEGFDSQNWTMELDGTIRENGRCLDTAGGGTTAGTLTVLDPCTGASTQVWTQGAASPGNAGNSLMNRGAAGMCLDDPGSVTVPGTQLQISACKNGLAAEKWVLPRT